MQKNWLLILKPNFSSLKFRFPYIISLKHDMNFYTEYLDGDILIQPWRPTSSNESRLFVEKFYDSENNEFFKRKNYNHFLYEDQCFYQKIFVRFSFYNKFPQFNSIEKTKEMDYCHDCSTEKCIMLRTCEFFYENILEENLKNLYDILYSSSHVELELKI